MHTNPSDLQTTSNSFCEQSPTNYVPQNIPLNTQISLVPPMNTHKLPTSTHNKGIQSPIVTTSIHRVTTAKQPHVTTHIQQTLPQAQTSRRQKRKLALFRRMFMNLYQCSTRSYVNA